MGLSHVKKRSRHPHNIPRCHKNLASTLLSICNKIYYLIPLDSISYPITYTILFPLLYTIIVFPLLINS